MISASAKDSNPCFRICFNEEGSCLYAANTDNMKIYDLEANKVLDIVMKPHRKILDLKCSSEYIYVADHTNKSVIVSSVKEDLLNYDINVQIDKSVASSGSNKPTFFQKSQSTDQTGSYGYGVNQSSDKFGNKKLSRQHSVNRNKNSILANNGMNLIRNSSNIAKDPYTGSKYSYNDFNDFEDSPDKFKPSRKSAKLPNPNPSQPIISPMETQVIIQKMTNSHAKVLKLLKNRKSQLINLQQCWSSGNSVKTLRYLLQSNDAGLTKDLIDNLVSNTISN